MSIEITAAVVGELGAPFGMEQLLLDEPSAGEVLVRLVGRCLPHRRAGPRGRPAVPDARRPRPRRRRAASIRWARESRWWPSATRSSSAGRSAASARTAWRRRAEILQAHRAGVGRRARRLTGGPPARRRPDGTPVSSHFFGQSSFATHSLTTAAAVVKVPETAPLELLGRWRAGCRPAPARCSTRLARARTPRSSSSAQGRSGWPRSWRPATRRPPRIVAVDRHESRLALARELGATDTADVPQTPDVVAAVAGLCDGSADYAIECTGVIPVVRTAADCVGLLGTPILIGGAPAGAEFFLDHLSTLWSKRVVGVLDGGGRSDQLINGIVELHAQGRFPLERLVEYFDFDDLEVALARSYAGNVVKPILRMPS